MEKLLHIVKGIVGALFVAICSAVPIAILVGGMGSNNAGFLLAAGGFIPFLIAAVCGMIISIILLAKSGWMKNGYFWFGVTICVVSVISAERWKQKEYDSKVRAEQDKIYPANLYDAQTGKLDVIAIQDNDVGWIPHIIDSGIASRIVSVASNVGRVKYIGADKSEDIKIYDIKSYELKDINNCSKLDFGVGHRLGLIQRFGSFDKCLLEYNDTIESVGSVFLARHKRIHSRADIVESLYRLEGFSAKTEPIFRWEGACENDFRRINTISFLSAFTGVKVEIERLYPETISGRIEKFNSGAMSDQPIIVKEAIQYFLWGAPISGRDCRSRVSKLDSEDFYKLDNFKVKFCRRTNLLSTSSNNKRIEFDKSGLYIVTEEDCIEQFGDAMRRGAF